MKTQYLIIGGVSLVALGVGTYLLLKPPSTPETKPTPGTTPPATGGGGSVPSTPPPAKSKFSKGTAVYAKDSASAKQYGGVKVRKSADNPNDAYKAFVGEEIGKTTGNVKVVGGMLFTEISVKTDWSFNNPFGGSGNKVWVYDEYLTTSSKGTIYEFAYWLDREVQALNTDEDAIYQYAKKFCNSEIKQLEGIFTERMRRGSFKGFITSNAFNLDYDKFINSFKNC